MPVSPREPSMLFGLGVPVVIGPMNGRMEYPPAFRRHNNFERCFFRLAGFEAVGFQTRWNLVKALLPWFLHYRSIDVIGTGVAHSHHGVRPDAITVIDNFLSDAQRGGHKLRAPYDLHRAGARAVDQAHLRVAIVSRVDPMKKVDLLLDAVERYGLDEYRFDIYGTGEDFDILRKRAAALSHVHFHGFVADIEDRLADADFLLHLCPIEVFGLAVLEAFLTRLVVIVPDAGGAGSLVADGVTGLRFRANDAADLCAVLRRATALPGTALQEMVDAGSATLEARFSQREGVRRYQQALSGMAAHRS